MRRIYTAGKADLEALLAVQAALDEPNPALLEAALAGPAGSGTASPGPTNPGTDNPGTDSPRTDNPGTDNPETDHPETDHPETDHPETDHPGTDSQDASSVPVPDGPLSVLACAVGGTPVGYAIVVPGETVYLPELAVRPDRQREGHGSALLGAVCERYRSRSKLRLTVAASNRDAREFYEHLGFESVDRLPEHFESGDAVVLVRPL